MRVRVCNVAEVGPGQMQAFSVEGLALPVLVINQGHRFVVTSGICPHEDVELAGGDVDGNLLSCPGHGYEFDLDSGLCVHDKSLCLRRFKPVIVGDVLHIDIDLTGLAS